MATPFKIKAKKGAKASIDIASADATVDVANADKQQPKHEPKLKIHKEDRDSKGCPGNVWLTENAVVMHR